MNKITRLSVFLLTLFLAGAASAWAQTEQSVEQLKKQIEDLKSRGSNSTSWSPAVKKAYDQSLNTLYSAYERASETEIGQLNELLKVVTDPAARKPLEDQIGQLKAFAKPAPVRNASIQTPNAVASTEAGSGNSNSGRGNKTNSNTEDRFTLKVFAQVKGTGYPVSSAHVKLLKLNPNTTPPEYQDAEEDFDCPSPCNTQGKTALEIKIRASDATYKVAIQKDRYYPFVQQDVIVPSAQGGTQSVVAELIPRDDEFHRALLGVEQAGISGGDNQQNVFLDLFISRPIFNGHSFTECGTRNTDDACKAPRHRIWGDIRITSVPQPKQNLFQSLNGAFGGAVGGSIGQITDFSAGFSFLTGYQLRLFSGSLAGNRYDFSAIAGGGASAALSPEKNVQIYKIPGSTDPERRQRLEKRLKDEAAFDPSRIGTTYTDIAFVTKERDRFLRSYYGGFRFETHYGDVNPSRPSGMFDVLFGQDEAVTGGRLQSTVLRLDGFYPLPIAKGNLVYLFGTAQLALKRSQTKDPLLLPLADTTQTLTSPTTLVVPVPAANRDVFRIGIGVNLFQVFSGSNTEKKN